MNTPRRRRIGFTVLVSLFLLVLAGIDGDYSSVIASPAIADTIAFSSNRSGNYDIYLIRADGSSLTNITNSPAIDEWMGDWSPDGTRITYWDNNTGDLYMMVVSSRQTTKLPVGFPIEHPKWSLDGNALVFDRVPDFDIYTFDLATFAATNLTPGHEKDRLAAWSPDGKRIMFGTEVETDNYDLFVMDADGSDPPSLLSTPHNEATGSWSANGSTIAFYAMPTDTYELYTMPATGGTPTQITFNLDNDYLPKYSPDGTRLLYYKYRNGTDYDIYMVDLASKQERLLFSSPGADILPIWKSITLPPGIKASAYTADSKPYTADTWTNQSVTVSFTCSDSGLGVASCGPNQTVSADGITSVNGTATDIIGNSATATFGPILIDKTKSTLSVSAKTADGTAYTSGSWTKQSVIVHFTCNDAGSGITTCPADQTVSAEGTTSSISGTATDRAGNSASISFDPIQIDKTPPGVSCRASPSTLWPANHKLVPVTVLVTLTEALSGSAGFTLISVTSNEPDNGLGDGDAVNDIQGFALGTATTTGSLRAERAGPGIGRMYTFAYRGMDKAGNASTCATKVAVPREQGK